MQEDLLSILKSHNIWWQTGKIPQGKENLPSRTLIRKLQEALPQERMLAITGPRRAGKTTLLYHLIKEILKKELPPTNVMYILCDDPDFSLALEKMSFGEIINSYHDEIADKQKPVYIFLDEVHAVPNWEKWLKKFYDLSYPMKFVISGSAALHIKKKAKESLSGRLLEYVLYPLDFKEFLPFYVFFNTNEAVDLNQIPAGIKEKFAASSSGKLEFSVLQEKILKIFEKFILWGGFPEGFSTPSIGLWQTKLYEDVIKKQIYYDIVKIFGIENPSLIEKMLYFIGKNQSQIFNYETFLSALPVRSKSTVINYVSYLKESFLIGENLKFSRKPLVKARKYFLLDSGLLNMILKNQSLLEAKNLGLVVEGIIQAQAYLNFDGIHYYRDPKGREVDLILETKQGLLPIEVKYSDKVSLPDLKNLSYFMERENIAEALVLTRSQSELFTPGNKKISLLPAWLFLA